MSTLKKNKRNKLSTASRDRQLFNVFRTARSFSNKKTKTNQSSNTHARSFNLADIRKSDISLIQATLKPQKEKYAAVAVFLYQFIETHPKFDPDFKLDINLDSIDIILILFEKIKTIFPETHIRLNLQNFNLPKLFIYHEFGILYGSSCAFNYLPKLNQKNKSCFNLITKFLYLIHRTIGQELFFNEHVEIELEQIGEFLIKDDPDNNPDDNKLNNAIISKYNGIATKYYQKIKSFKKTITLESFEQELIAYHPHKEIYRNMKNWMKKGLELAKSPYSLNQFYAGYNIYDSNELLVPNHAAFQMVWSTTDNVWDMISTRLNDYVDNCQIMPFVYSQSFSEAPKDWSTITISSFLIDYSDFMNTGCEYNFYLSKHLSS